MPTTIHQGDTVLVPAGISFTTTAPGAKSGTTRRAQKVRVHMLLPASEITIRWHGEEIIWYSGADERQVRNLYGTIDPNELIKRGLMRCEEDKSPFYRIKVSEPMIVWAGSGGYWREAKVADVTKI